MYLVYMSYVAVPHCNNQPNTEILSAQWSKLFVTTKRVLTSNRKSIKTPWWDSKIQKKSGFQPNISPMQSNAIHCDKQESLSLATEEKDDSFFSSRWYELEVAATLTIVERATAVYYRMYFFAKVASETENTCIKPVIHLLMVRYNQ